MACGRSLLILFSVILFVSPSFQISVEVLTPTKEGPEVGLIIAPGAQISGEAYKPLGLAIQEQSDLKIWIALMDGFTQGLVNPLQILGAVESAKKALKNKGMTSNIFFLAGHSLAGTVVSNFCNSFSKEVNGALLYGSYLPRGTSLNRYPVPILTLTGDLDGITRITRIEQSFEGMEVEVKKNQSAMFRIPVITIQGMNHGQFASGPMPDQVVAYDLEPELSNDTAHSMVAMYTSAFIIANSKLNSSLEANATKTLQDGYTSTKKTMMPLKIFRSLSVNPQLQSTWSGFAQKVVSKIADDRNINTTNPEVSEGRLILTHPKYSVKDGVLYISTVTEVALQLNPLDVSTFYASPIQLQVEMKSHDAIKALLVNGTFQNRNSTCKDINQAAVEYAFSQCSPLVQNRYSKRGRPVVLKDDVDSGSSQLWLLQQLLIEDTKQGLEVTSYSCSVPYNPSRASTTGLFYCKLLDPYRAMEWMYVDSLRKYDGPLV